VNLYSTAALKLIIVALFFISVTVSTLVYQIFTTKLTPESYFSIFLDYVVCEASGTDVNRNCYQFLDTSRITPLYNLNIASLFLEAIIPPVIIILNTNWKVITNKSKRFGSLLSQKL